MKGYIIMCLLAIYGMQWSGIESRTLQVDNFAEVEMHTLSSIKNAYVRSESQLRRVETKLHLLKRRCKKMDLESVLCNHLLNAESNAAGQCVDKRRMWTNQRHSMSTYCLEDITRRCTQYSSGTQRIMLTTAIDNFFAQDSPPDELDYFLLSSSLEKRAATSLLENLNCPNDDISLMQSLERLNETLARFTELRLKGRKNLRAISRLLRFNNSSDSNEELRSRIFTSKLISQRSHPCDSEDDVCGDVTTSSEAPTTTSSTIAATVRSLESSFVNVCSCKYAGITDREIASFQVARFHYSNRKEARSLQHERIRWWLAKRHLFYNECWKPGRTAIESRLHQQVLHALYPNESARCDNVSELIHQCMMLPRTKEVFANLIEEGFPCYQTRRRNFIDRLRRALLCRRTIPLDFGSFDRIAEDAAWMEYRLAPYHENVLKINEIFMIIEEERMEMVVNATIFGEIDIDRFPIETVLSTSYFNKFTEKLNLLSRLENNEI